MSLQYRRVVPPGGIGDQQLQDAVSRVLREIANELILSYGTPTRIVYSAYTARLGQMVKLDPSGGAFQITLPSFSRADEGKSIALVNVGSSTNTVTISASGGTVNGASSVTVSKGYFVRQAVALDGDSNRWLLTTVLDGATSAAEEPIWKWNGSDLTQFGTKISGTSVTSSTVSLATAFGVNWVQASVEAFASTYWRNSFIILPIDYILPVNDYYIVADYHVAQFATFTYHSVGFLVREDGTGNGYALQMIGEAMEIARWNAGNTATALTNDGGISSYLPMDTTTEQLRLKFEVSGQTALMGERHFRHGYLESAGTYTSGRACLLAGNAQRTGQTAIVRFRNIEIYAA